MNKNFLMFFSLFLFIYCSFASAKTIDVETETLKINASVIYSNEAETGWGVVMSNAFSLVISGRVDEWPFYGYNLDEVREASICDRESPYADSKAGGSVSFVMPGDEDHPYIGWNIHLRKGDKNHSDMRVRDLCSIIQSQSVMELMAEELYKFVGQDMQNGREWYLLIDEPMMDFDLTILYMAPPQPVIDSQT